MKLRINMKSLRVFSTPSTSLISMLLIVIVILHISLPPKNSLVLAVPAILSNQTSSPYSPYSSSSSSLDKDSSNKFFYHTPSPKSENNNNINNKNKNNDNLNVNVKSGDIISNGGDNGADSAEDGQYYDDDASVTFVTEDDIYDEGGGFFVPGGSSQQYGLYHHGPHKKHMEIVDERCPPLPQEVALSETKLCEATRCQRDSDCSQSGDSRLCCFNGCVHSCLLQVDAPLAFDWLEETELKLFHNGTEDSSSSSSSSPLGEEGRSLRPKTLMSHTAPEMSIALPGGCLLNPQQYEDLRLFRQHEHVNSCTCSQGDVVCHVNVDKDRLIST